MSQKQQHYEQEFKNKIVRLHIEEGRTYKSLTAEYGVSKASRGCGHFFRPLIPTSFCIREDSFLPVLI